MRILECINVSKRFGGLEALKNITIFINKGEKVGLIGPNGAGKTTLFNVIMGVYKPDAGRIIFNGEDITKLKTHQICRKGICRTFQIVKPFPKLSVFKNVMVGAIFGSGQKISESEVIDILELVSLRKKSDIQADALTFPEKRLLELARALAARPKLLLLDETMAGLNPAECKALLDVIERIRKEMNITIIMVEHVMRVIMTFADRVIVLHHGEKIAEGTPKEIISNKRVIEVYLGRRNI